MPYRVEVAARAARDLASIYRRIQAENSVKAQAWFNGLERSVVSLDAHPSRCPVIPEDDDLRHLLYGKGRDVYRVIFNIDETLQLVTVLHIRHGARRPLRRRGSGN